MVRKKRHNEKLKKRRKSKEYQWFLRYLPRKKFEDLKERRKQKKEIKTKSKFQI